MAFLWMTHNFFIYQIAGPSSVHYSIINSGQFNQFTLSHGCYFPHVNSSAAHFKYGGTRSKWVQTLIMAPICFIHIDTHTQDSILAWVWLSWWLNAKLFATSSVLVRSLLCHSPFVCLFSSHLYESSNSRYNHMVLSFSWSLTCRVKQTLASPHIIVSVCLHLSELLAAKV